MLELVIKPKYRKVVNKSLLEDAYKITLTNINDNLNPNVSVYITDDLEMKRYNLKYRGFDSSTDVLSFNNEYIDLETGEAYLGDIIVSFETAIRQATECDHPVEKELQFLVIHGLLHLFGYNHEKEQEEIVMWQLQNKIIRALNLPQENSII